MDFCTAQVDAGSPATILELVVDHHVKSEEAYIIGINLHHWQVCPKQHTTDWINGAIALLGASS